MGNDGTLESVSDAIHIDNEGDDDQLFAVDDRLVIRWAECQLWPLAGRRLHRKLR